MDMDYIITDTLNPQVVLSEAREWLDQFYKERNLGPDKYHCVIPISFLHFLIPNILAIRLTEVADEIKLTGTYRQTYDELAYGAKVAWRNASRCINRIQWNRMEVLDFRAAKTAEV